MDEEDAEMEEIHIPVTVGSALTSMAPLSRSDFNAKARRMSLAWVITQYHQIHRLNRQR